MKLLRVPVTDSTCEKTEVKTLDQFGTESGSDAQGAKIKEVTATDPQDLV